MHFFELFMELYMICTHFSHIKYILRIHLVKISLIFIKYEPSTERSKGLAHERFFLDPYVVKNHDVSSSMGLKSCKSKII